MAKILVADDNSNVQKTVSLALADLGVEVISVNNGEAAVRKLPESCPDLVLADIFMPVRNGYEVCEYIKKDSRFAHVPVVLLVGAFDPLDEREAQRVGADGILKKPFVPPDPLIAMVKTLLDRTLGERLVAVSVGKPAAATAAKPGAPAITKEFSPAPETPGESPAQQFPLPSARVTFDEGEHPVAFGQLLETPARDAIRPATDVIEPVDNDQILTSPRDATLGDPIFWQNDAPESEPEVESPEGIASDLEMRTWKQEDDSLPRREEAALLQPIEPLELVQEEAVELPQSVVQPQSLVLDAAAQADLTVEPGIAPELAANPTEWMATAPKEHIEEAAEAGAVEPIESAQIPSPVSTPVSEKVTKPVESPVSAQQETKPEDQTPKPGKTQPSLPPFTQKAEDTARSIPKRDWADMAATLQPGATAPISQRPEFATVPGAPIPAVTTGNSPQAPVSPAVEPSPDAALVDAVVQRVLDKMRPQVVDIITKEFLRPIVQALVHREIEKR